MSTKSIMDTSLTGRRRNRLWPEALKREVVEAALAPGASVSVVARRYDVNANQVFGWRKRYREGSLAPINALNDQVRLADELVIQPFGGDTTDDRPLRTGGSVNRHRPIRPWRRGGVPHSSSSKWTR